MRWRVSLQVARCSSTHHASCIMFHWVKSCIVHGPCGNINPHAPCIKNGLCSKGYSKVHQDSEVTTISGDGYPLYARPDDGRSFPIKVLQTTFDANNCWMIPYNRYLSTKYNCHITVMKGLEGRVVYPWTCARYYLNQFVLRTTTHASLPLFWFCTLWLSHELRMSSAVNCRATFLFFCTGVNPSIKLSELGVCLRKVRKRRGRGSWKRW